MSNPRISVIMNCLNSAKYLREAIDSVYAQTYSDWEIVFWDNCSTDDSPAIAKSYDSRLRYFRGESTVPLGEARNLAIKNAQGEFIAFLDCDDIWMPEKLELQLQEFECNVNCGLVYSDAFRVDVNLGLTGLYSEDFVPLSGNVFCELLENNVVAPFSAIIIPSRVMDMVGAFNCEYEIVEDADLILRIAEKYEIQYVSRPLVKYRFHDSNVSKKVELNVAESLHLLDFWLERRKDIFADHPRLKQKAQFRLYSLLIPYYIKRNQLIEAVGAFANAIKCYNFNVYYIFKDLYVLLYVRRVKRIMKELLRSFTRAW